jgi:hydrogenase maturation factor
MLVLGVDRERSLAICTGPDDGGGDGEEVAIDLVEPVAVGQRLLVHAGVALANLGHVSLAGGGDR